MTNESSESNPQSIGRLAAFRYRDFRLFWFSVFTSNVGTWMQMTAVNWLLYQLTQSPLQLGINGLFRAVPAIALGIFSGALADRYDRKKLLLTTQCLLGSLALLLGVLDHSENIRPWHIYTITFFSAAVSSCDGPARQALFPSLIPRALLPNAVALNSILWKGAALLGPMLGGIAISWIGTSGAFYANAASFLAVIIALLLMRSHSIPPQQTRHIVHEMKAGLSFVYSQNVILGVIIMEATTSIFGLDNAILTIFASDILRVGAQGFGLLQSARGLGAVIGSILFITIGQRPYQGKILLISALLYGAGFALFGLAPSFTLALLVAHFCRRRRYDLGIGAQHNSAVADSRPTARPSHGHLSIEQSGPQPARPSRNRTISSGRGRSRRHDIGRVDRFCCDACDGVETFRIAPLQPRHAAPRAKTRRSSLRRPRIVENIFRLSEIRRQHLREH